LEQEEMKRIAAEKAVDLIEENMIVGLGTGSTVKYALKKIGTHISEGLQIKGIPTSNETKKLALKYNIPLTTLSEHPEIDLTIDGADEINSDLNLIKGGGGALTREKIIAFHSKKLVIVADDSKVVKSLGIDFALPVEVVKFGWETTKKTIETFECICTLRKIFEDPFITDNGNYIIDCEFDRIPNPEDLEQKLNMIPGVVENGLFIDLAHEAIVGGSQGIMTLEKEQLAT